MRSPSTDPAQRLPLMVMTRPPRNTLPVRMPTRLPIDNSGELNRPLTPILLNFPVFLNFLLSAFYCKDICFLGGSFPFFSRFWGVHLGRRKKHPCFFWGGKFSSPLYSEREEKKTTRRVRSTPYPETFEKYRDTPPISIAILLQKYALLLAESRIDTTNLYHDTVPVCIAICLHVPRFCRKARDSYAISSLI